MVTHSELILIGQLIVSILTLFVHIYDNKRFYNKCWGQVKNLTP